MLQALVRLLTSGEARSTSETGADRDDQHDENQATIDLALPVKLKRRGNEMRLVIEGENHNQLPDPHLVRMVASAHIYLERMIENPTLGPDVSPNSSASTVSMLDGSCHWRSWRRAVSIRSWAAINQPIYRLRPQKRKVLTSKLAGR